MNFFEENNYQIIKNDKGNIFKFADVDNYSDFINGEIYFSEVNPNTSKPWRRHKRINTVIGVVSGEINIKIRSDNSNQLISKKLSLKNSTLIKIKFGTWYAFENQKNIPCLLFAMLDKKHDDGEVERL
tara:strand:- start:1686 stop:2069 length:384 start_codon:yes stop_codon:yes gene_type:complete